MKPSAERFYKTVAVSLVETGGETAYAVRLDGRPIRTPGGRILALPTAESAAAVAAEWRAQSERIDVNTMPLTRLANTALDRVSPNAPAVIDMLLDYAGADLLCYRAEAPADLVSRQHRQWQPLLDWAASRWGAHLAVTSGVVPIAQSATALAALRRPLEALDGWHLTVLAIVAQTCGSLVLAMAVVEERIDAETAFALSQLDELYQSEQWGDDYEAAQRRKHLRDEIGDACRFMVLVQGIEAGTPSVKSHAGGRGSQ